jgi:hypothetical protein
MQHAKRTRRTILSSLARLIVTNPYILHISHPTIDWNGNKQHAGSLSTGYMKYQHKLLQELNIIKQAVQRNGFPTNHVTATQK